MASPPTSPAKKRPAPPLAHQTAHDYAVAFLADRQRRMVDVAVVEQQSAECARRRREIIDPLIAQWADDARACIDRAIRLVDDALTMARARNQSEAYVDVPYGRFATVPKGILDAVRAVFGADYEMFVVKFVHTGALDADCEVMRAWRVRVRKKL